MSAAPAVTAAATAMPTLAELMPVLSRMARRYAVSSGTLSQLDDYAQEAHVAAWLSLAKPAASPEHARRRALKAGRGAILDLARRDDWLSRGERQLLQRAERLGQQQPDAGLGHIAQQLGISTTRLRAIAAHERHARAAQLRIGLDLTHPAEPATPADQTETDAQRAQLLRRLPRDLAALAPYHRRVIWRLLGGRSLIAIAADCGASPSAIYWRLKSAIAQLHARVDLPPVRPGPPPESDPEPDPEPPPEPARTYTDTDYRHLIRGPLAAYLVP
ncbi:MAG: hypothetical protein LCH73_02780 [Proteobacteria bacterium]|nr:hypothetical protein [Pseudomonadota bacterium]